MPVAVRVAVVGQAGRQAGERGRGDRNPSLVNSVKGAYSLALTCMFPAFLG